MYTLIIISLLIFLAGASNGVMDLLQFKFKHSWFARFNHQFWNPTLSWNNKNKYADKNRFLHWFQRHIGVMWSDGWHLIKAIMILLMMLATSIAVANTESLSIHWLYVLPVLLWFIFAAGFYTTYKLL